MKLMNVSNKLENKSKSERFSEFFLSASEKKKEKVLKEVAHRANKDQQKLVLESRLNIRTN